MIGECNENGMLFLFIFEDMAQILAQCQSQTFLPQEIVSVVGAQHYDEPGALKKYLSLHKLPAICFKGNPFRGLHLLPNIAYS